MSSLKRHAAIALLLFFCSPPSGAQDGLLKLGDRSYEAFAYMQAIEYYEQAFKKDATSIPHARKLAESYWNVRQLKQSEQWYAIVASSSQAQPLDVYRYAELLRVSGQYADSELWLKRYGAIRPEDSRTRTKENAKSRLETMLEREAFTDLITAVPFNSERADMTPFVFEDTIYFSSARKPQYLARRVDPWNDQPFMNIYQGHVAKDGTVNDVRPFRSDMNTTYHESNLVISDDGREMYFTRNNFLDGERTVSDDGVNNLQIYSRRRTGTTWGPIVPFIFNSPMYSTGHPALSADGQRLYFTSDKPGGIGGKDLYVCLRTPHGSWGAPNNLGTEINTEGDEMFPFIHENILYFASDGHLGLGGLDLFRVTVRAKGFGVVENLNAPVNSKFDDFGMCLTKDGTVGYMTSDRDGATFGEEIYRFQVKVTPQEERKWIGRVLDQNDALPIAHLPVKLYDLNQNELARTVTSQNGTYEFPSPTVPAEVHAEIPGGATAILPQDDITISTFGDTELPDLYIDGVMDLPVNAILTDARTNEPLAGVRISVKDTRDGSILFVGDTDERGISQGQIPDRRYGDDMNLEVTFTKHGYFKKVSFVDFRILMFLEQSLTGPEGQTLSAVINGVDIAKAMNLRPIYFDFREAKIRSDAMGELDLVAEVMRVDPAMRIDLRSHTDSRASQEYNQALSQRRAESTRQYLIEQGIEATRITAHGFGERELVNECADGTECSEEEHQLNRRTEFIVTNCSNNALGSFSE